MFGNFFHYYEVTYCSVGLWLLLPFELISKIIGGNAMVRITFEWTIGAGQGCWLEMCEKINNVANIRILKEKFAA